MSANAYHEIYALVRRIPAGRVSSYGRVATMLGRPPGHARLVGYALRALRSGGEADVPWWRVINAAGRVSNPYAPSLQRTLLEAEGVQFNSDGYVDLACFLWEG